MSTAEAWTLDRAGALLTIDLDAVAANYRLLRDLAAPALCAGVLKADAYGLGLAHVAPALLAAGCRHFFVAHLGEGMNLRAVTGPGPEIHVLHGPFRGTEADFVAHDLVPVLNSLDQVEGWAGHARLLGRSLPAVVQVDSGMARFGLSRGETERLAESGLLSGLSLRYVMSHLAKAERGDDPANAGQLETFARLRALLPPAGASLANSSGVFLGGDFHFDLVRPGAALYGLAPMAGKPNPLRPVIRLQAKVVQTRRIAAGLPVGYGGTWTTSVPTRIATIATGYADGFLRSAGNRGAAYLGEVRLPIVGAVSMDSITLDATALPEDALPPGTLVDLIGPHNPVDEVARAAGTIGYEVLTNLGHRYHRRYLPAGPGTAGPLEEEGRRDESCPRRRTVSL